MLDREEPEAVGKAGLVEGTTGTSASLLYVAFDETVALRDPRKGMGSGDTHEI